MHILAYLFIITCVYHITCTPNPIIIKGSKFFDSKTHAQFFIQGVAYQPQKDGKIIDPISNARRAEWGRDLKLMRGLGVNVIRVYEVDPDVEHDEFMNALAQGNVYLLLDVGSGKQSINRANPSYTVELLKGYVKTVDAFSKYDNLLGFVGGNEVINKASNTNAAPFVKALIRDLKTHIKETAPRPIPVGYAATDDDATRLAVAAYMACGHANETADFLGINLYEWCGNSSYEISGYKDRTENFKNYPIPVFLSEYGCNMPLPRTFTEVATIYGPDMTPVFSGGLVYEYSDEGNDYGLVKISASNTTILPDYYTFKNALSQEHPHGISMDQQSATSPLSTCPSQSSTWLATSVLPPTPNSCICDAMVKSLTCVSSSMVQTASANTVESTLSKVCGMLHAQNPDDACPEIAPGNGTSASGYGVYSACSLEQKLSFAMNKFYFKQQLRVRSEACDFAGMARLVLSRTRPTSAKSVDTAQCTSDSMSFPSSDSKPARSVL
ncbi:hypothetical protein SmJEL517_g01747 [Synchytrium microbalum]|uniref:1,3-beta-glucanosyltransferase n=1 Tax=Synchytrium microbalum TaxID=1806994 RepID=A0A507C331_9FUNG|nr:uncharacterized protein SmJEL517_g01747 [Synchytrium microbalum]TPX35920.1 hypothetical protein SmJEL517_g01747 [Synchytrium microbalum]